MEVYLKNKRIRLDPTMSIGKGGEADIYDIGHDRVVKVFKPASHPDYQGLMAEQQAARERLAEHQFKLPSFPKDLPDRVIKPEELATEKTGQKIIGYTMTFLRNCEVLLKYAERGYRQAGVSNETIIKIFQDLFTTVDGVHRLGVVIGDFNDLNVLVRDQEAYLIDADSFQFGKFLCRLYTEKFVDPLLCDPQAKRLILIKPHQADSDWYAFAVMLMQCLLFVDPYGGVYLPKNTSKKIPHPARPLHRITVFNPEVRYPKPAVPYGVLPDDLLHYFHQVFEKDQREVFPLLLLENLRWTKCTNCGIEHGRAVCPNCAVAAPAAIKEVAQIRGKVIVTRFFKTDGQIVHAKSEQGILRWLYYENRQFKREDGSVVTAGDLNPRLRFRIRGNETIIAQNGLMVTLGPSLISPEKISVDSYYTLPVFDTNDRYRYWLNNGQLLRDGQYGSEYIGDVLTGQTLIWAGNHFGFGFYRASNLQVSFIFDAERHGLNDMVKIPIIPGQLIDATCYLARDYGWFLVSSQERGVTVNRCWVIKSNGTIEAMAEVEQGDDSWLGHLRGKCAANNFLLSVTDEGIVRLEANGGQIIKTREFPDTEPFVNSGCHLFLGKDGIYVVSRQEITMLKIH